MDIPPTILLVEDDAVFREQMARALRRRGCGVDAAPDRDSALTSVRTRAPEFALVDLRLPGASGLEVISEIQALSPTTRSFLFSGTISEEIRAEAIERGACGCLKKPLDADEVVAAIQGAAPTA